MNTTASVSCDFFYFTFQEYTPLDSCPGSGQSTFAKGRQHMVLVCLFIILFSKYQCIRQGSPGKPIKYVKDYLKDTHD